MGNSIKTFRQGDLLFVEVGDIATDKLKKSTTGIIALGEVTGHKHRVIGADVYTKAKTTNWGEVIDAMAGEATITHEEHGTVVLPAGKKYQIIHQREYQAKALPRYVAD